MLWDWDGTLERIHHALYVATREREWRKRHILVDTLGLLLNVVVHPADVQDRDGARLVLDRAPVACSRLSSTSSPTPATRDPASRTTRRSKTCGPIGTAVESRVNSRCSTLTIQFSKEMPTRRAPSFARPLLLLRQGPGDRTTTFGWSRCRFPIEGARHLRAQAQRRFEGRNTMVWKTPALCATVGLK